MSDRVQTSNRQPYRCGAPIAIANTQADRFSILGDLDAMQFGHLDLPI
jgi:hypothetical protein